MVMQELEDLHIGRQVILTYSTKGRQPGEEQRQNGLGPIPMNLPADIFTPAMIDALMMVAQLIQEVVTFGRIGVDGASNERQHEVIHRSHLQLPRKGESSNQRLGMTSCWSYVDSNVRSHVDLKSKFLTYERIATRYLV
jgi:hypothetical protein